MGNYEIKSGDCLWNIIKKHFNNTLSNSEISKKSQRISKSK